MQIILPIFGRMAKKKEPVTVTPVPKKRVDGVTQKRFAPGNKKTLVAGGNNKTGKLTDSMIMFCHEYLIDFNLGRAVKDAGYTHKYPTSYGLTLLKKPQIQAYLKEQKQKRIEECEVTADMITRELFKIAFYDMNDFVNIVEVRDGTGKVTGHNVEMKPTSALADGNGKIIKSIKIGRRGIELALNNKEQAIEMLAKRIGYFEADNKQKQPSNSVAVYIPDNGRGDVKQPEPDGD